MLTSSSVPHDVHARYPLVPEQIAAYQRRGFVRLPHVLSAGTIARYEPEITGKVVELNTQHLPMAERSTYGKAFLQVENLWPHSRLVRELVFSRRLAAIAADLMGVRGVRLYHDQALYKEAGGGITPWHADQYYWPLDSHRTITAWVPLQEVPAAMGPLAFAAGSQAFSFGRDLPISDESEATLQAALAEQGFPLDSTPYDLGTVSFHSGWTFHRADPNLTPTPRRVMTMIYMDADIRVTEPVNQFQRSDRDRWLGGAAPGPVPDGGLNPVLFERWYSPDVQRKIGVMGGTFDPIHHGHLVAASEVADRFALDEVVFVPTGQPWQKSDKVVSPAEDRYLMTVVATASNPRFSVSRVDIDRGGPTYTADTLGDLHRLRPDADLFFITGADALSQILSWHKVDELFELAHFVGVTRPGYELVDRHLPEGAVSLVEVPALAISSTDCRRRVGAGHPVWYLVPDGVVQYISKRSLYRSAGF